MDNFKEKLTCSRIEDKDGTINRFGCQITLKGLMDGDSINVGIIDKPDDLISE